MKHTAKRWLLVAGLSVGLSAGCGPALTIDPEEFAPRSDAGPGSEASRPGELVESIAPGPDRAQAPLAVSASPAAPWAGHATLP